MTTSVGGDERTTRNTVRHNNVTIVKGVGIIDTYENGVTLAARRHSRLGSGPVPRSRPSTTAWLGRRVSVTVSAASASSWCCIAVCNAAPRGPPSETLTDDVDDDARSRPIENCLSIALIDERRERASESGTRAR